MKWFYSYTAALLIPVLFGVLIYLFSAQVISRQAERLQGQNAEKDYTYLAQTLEGVSSIGKNILMNNEVTGFSQQKGESQETAVRLKRVQDLLIDACIADNMIENIYVFFPKKGLIVSDNNWQSMAENTILDMVSMMHLYDEEFLPILSGKPYNRVYLIEKNGFEHVYYTCCGEGRRAFMEQEAVVMISLNLQMLQRQLAGDVASALLLASEDVDTLLQFGSEELAEAVSGKLATSREEEYFSGDDYYLRKRELSDYGLTMWNVYSNQQRDREMSRIWQILIIYLVCCVLMGPALVFWISRRNYTPVEKLIGAMESHGLSVGEQNEFAAIHQNMLGLLKGLRDQEKELRQQQEFYEESDLYFLLCTNRGQRENENGIEKRLEQDGFLVVSFDVEDTKEVLSSEGDSEKVDLELLDFVIANVVQEFYADFPARISGKLEDQYCVILNFPVKEFAALNGMLQEKTRNICRFLQEQFQFSICANISRMKTGRELLPQAWEEIREINEFRDYIGSEEVVLRYDTFSDDEEIRREMNYFTDISRLSELFRGHRHKEAEALLAEIRENYPAAVWVEEEKEVTAPTEERAGKSAEQTIRKVEEYLLEHYLDPQITVSSVAYLFELNPSYLSRSFCKVNGKGMLEYLTALRLEHAKRCMEAGESVNSAAEHSGFYTCRPFIRAFKEEMGVTPGEYYKKQKK